MLLGSITCSMRGKGLAQMQADREKAYEAEAKGCTRLASWIHERQRQ